MIALRDGISLPPGVSLRGGELVDETRGVSIPLNASARVVLAHATIAGAADALTRAGSPDGTRDALAFCRELNERFLLNVSVPLWRRLLPLRYGLRPKPPARRLGGELRELVRGLLPSATAVVLLLTPLGLALGPVGAAAALAAGLGILLHELAHALALHRVPRALVLEGLTPSVLHPRLAPSRALVVAAAGPLAPALAGLALSPRSYAASLPLAAHALALTVLAPDGRNACGLS